MTIDWKQEKQRVLARIQKEIGFRAPPSLKAYIDQRAGAVYDREDLGEYEGTARDFMEAAKRGISAKYLTSSDSEKSQNPSWKSQNPTKKRYQRPLKKRLYLVDFIIRKQLTSRKQPNRIRKTIRWKDICSAWNEAHPNDPMTPKVLKATFYRATRDEDLQREYLKQTGVLVSDILAWNRLINLMTALVGSSDLAVDWAIVLELNDIHLDRHFPTPKVERMIRNNPYYARQVMNELLAEWIMQTRLIEHSKAFEHFKAARQAYKPIYFGKGAQKTEGEK